MSFSSSAASLSFAVVASSQKRSSLTMDSAPKSGVSWLDADENMRYRQRSCPDRERQTLHGGLTSRYEDVGFDGARSKGTFVESAGGLALALRPRPPLPATPVLAPK